MGFFMPNKILSISHILNKLNEVKQFIENQYVEVVYLIKVDIINNEDRLF